MQRLPPGSRVRRAYIERAARTSFEAWVRGDYDVLRSAADPKIEVHIEMASGSDGFEVPVGLDEIYHGPTDTASPWSSGRNPLQTGAPR